MSRLSDWVLRFCLALLLWVAMLLVSAAVMYATSSLLIGVATGSTAGFLLWIAYDCGYDRGWDDHTPD